MAGDSASWLAAALGFAQVETDLDYMPVAGLLYHLVASFCSSHYSFVLEFQKLEVEPCCLAVEDFVVDLILGLRWKFCGLGTDVDSLVRNVRKVVDRQAAQKETREIAAKQPQSSAGDKWKVELRRWGFAADIVPAAARAFAASCTPSFGQEKWVWCAG